MNFASKILASLTSVALMACLTGCENLKPGRHGGFQHEQGDYHHPPNVVVQPGEPLPELPKELPCPGSYYIYASDAQWVANCNGFGGPNDSGNEVCDNSEAAAKQAAAQIGCPKECRKVVSEIWRGWDCKWDNRLKRNLAVCAVELKVECVLASPTSVAP